MPHKVLETGRDHATGARARRARHIAAAGAAALVVALALPVAGTAAERGPTAHLSSKSAAPAPQGAIGLCSRYDWACASGRSASLSAEQVRLAELINRRINSTVRQIEDIDQYRRNEYWTLPTARGGDCEDLALLKKAELIRNGLPPDRLLLATVLDRKRNNHAVLVLRTGNGDYVLDSLTSQMLHWSRTSYSFLKLQDPRAPERWTAILAGGIFKG